MKEKFKGLFVFIFIVTIAVLMNFSFSKGAAQNGGYNQNLKGTVTSVTGTAPLNCSGTTAVTCSLPNGAVVNSCAGTVPGVLYRCAAPISSAQILAQPALESLIAAPGSGLMIVLAGIPTFELVHGSSTYSGGGSSSMYLQYGAQGIFTVGDAVVDAASTSGTPMTQSGISISGSGNTVNTALSWEAYGTYTTGNGTGIINLLYYVLDGF